MERILYYHVIKERVPISFRVEGSNIWNEWGSIEQDLMQFNYFWKVTYMYAWDNVS